MSCLDCGLPYAFLARSIATTANLIFDDCVSVLRKWNRGTAITNRMMKVKFPIFKWLTGDEAVSAQFS